MPDAELAGGGDRVVRFVPRVAGRADGEGGNIAAQLGYRPADQARIHAAAEERADGHIGFETKFDRFEKTSLGFFDSLVKRYGLTVYRLRFSVTLPRDHAAGPFNYMTGRDLTYILIDIPLIGHIAKLKKINDTLFVQLLRQAGVM